MLATLLAPLLCAAPYRPADDAQVLERVPPRAQSRIAARTTATPEQAAQLAQKYIEQSRREGDPRWLGYAQGVLQPWWTQPEPPPPVLLLRATLLQSRHQFEAALADLDRLLQKNPADAQAWLTRATVLRVQGRYAEARTACLKLVGLTDEFVPTLCALAVRGLQGGLQPALVQLRALQPASKARDTGLQAWYWAERTEMEERSGDVPAAAAAYREALSRVPDDLGLRAAHADFLLDQGQPEQALAAVTRDPEDARVDALRLRQLLAQKALNRVDPELQAALADGFAAARRRGEELHLREEARYVLDVQGDAAAALKLAQQNWAVQHEPWDVRLLLATAAAAGAPQTVSLARAWLKQTGYEDARLHRWLEPAK